MQTVFSNNELCPYHKQNTAKEQESLILKKT